jgi:putative ABC transport system permease protein
MFFAWRDAVAARTRTLLLGLVVALVAMLVVVVSGFASGLTDDTTSAIRRLPATHLSFARSASSEQFARSLVPAGSAERWSRQQGVEAATPFGTTIVHGRTSAGTDLDLAVFGIVPDSFLAPDLVRGTRLPAGGNGVIVSAQLASNGVTLGQQIAMTTPAMSMTVIGVTGRSSFGHVPAAYTSLQTWQHLRFSIPAGQSLSTAVDQATGVALRMRPGADIAAADRALDMRTVTRTGAFAAAPGYAGENTIMSTIRIFLYVIAALIVAAFFVVTTLQRRRELAVIRALGASTRYLVQTTLLQAGVLVIPAVSLGVLGGAGLGSLLRHAVPFRQSPAALASAGLLLSLVGIAGALLAVRPVVRTDPLVALAAQR